jgi:glycosyltransferase involved in cell wall biosynthesis
MDLSIICPCLKIGTSLSLAVQSIEAFAPTDIRYEFILVTPDANHQDLARRFEHLTVIQEPAPSGVYSAMNQGLAVCRGKYVFFLGDDDIALPGLWAVLRTALDNDADLVAASVYWGDRGPYRPTRSKYLLWFKNWCHQGIVYKSSLFKAAGYNLKYRIQADHEANLRFMHDDLLKKIFNRDVVTSWYSGSGLSSKGPGDVVFWNEMPELSARFCGFLESTAVKTLHRLAGGPKPLPGQTA